MQSKPKLISPYSSAGKKDYRNHVVVEGLQNGVVVVFIKKQNIDEEAFHQPDYAVLLNDEQLLHKLGFLANVNRPGVDGAYSHATKTVEQILLIVCLWVFSVLIIALRLLAERLPIV